MSHDKQILKRPEKDGCTPFNFVQLSKPTELLGCYEQMNKKQKRQKYIENLIDFVENFISVMVLNDGKLVLNGELIQSKLQLLKLKLSLIHI